MVGADTKAYLYLSPARLLSRAWSMWDPNTGMGTVTHQNLGYLLPMGPWYWAWHALGVPIWVAQRLWLGTLLFAAGAGVVFLLRTLGWRRALMAPALLYMLSPYVVQYEARISAILMPWAALPWMVAFTVRAVRSRGWRDPALFAIVTTIVGGVNATSLLLAGIAPALWLPFAVWGERSATWRQAAAAGLRIAALTLVTALWWIAGLSIEAGYGLNVLRYTETVQTVATSGTAAEVVRGLGNWYFYGLDAIAPWVQPAVDYTQWVWLVGVSLAVPAVAVASAAVVRWRLKLYFAVLALVGVALAVGVHPYSHPSLLGALMKSFANGSTVGLALRSTGRAVPLVVLAVAVLTGAALHAAWERRPRLGAVLVVGVAALAVADMTPLFIGQFVDNQLQRPERVPAYWTAAAAYLQQGGSATRVWEEPGADFLHYRWGATLDPITPGLIDRPYVDRELVPTGGAGSADLLRAIDERLQEGWLEPAAIAPLARRMAVGDVVLRSDLQWERFRTPRPQETWAKLTPAPAGLAAPVGFGPPQADGPTAVPFLDEQALALPASAPQPPAVAVYPVADPQPIIRTEAAVDPIVLAGDGQGMVDAAAAGLLSGDNPVLYAADHPAIPPGADLVLTDSNRKQSQRYGTIRQTLGYTQAAGETPLAADPNNAPLPLFPGAGDDAATVAQESGDGIDVVRASGYGSTVTYDPASRPDLAYDGDPGTAWTVGALGDVVGQFLQADLSAPVTTDHVTLQQPFSTEPPPGTRWITRATLRFDGGAAVVADLGPGSRSAAGQRVTFPTRTFRTLRITIDATNVARTATTGTNGVGFSEVAIGDHPPRVDEVLRLPTDLLAGTDTLGHRLTVLLTRLQTNPAEPFAGNPEPALARTFTLPTARTFAVGGSALISAYAPDWMLDPLLGRPNPAGTLIANSSGRLPGDLGARSSSALDGDPTTAWSPARGPQAGAWLQVDLPHPVALSHFDLQVVADGRHSVPTTIGLSVDGGASRTVALPPIADRSQPGAVATVPVSLPGVTAQHRVVVTFESVRDVTTVDNLGHQRVILPIGIAELGLSGIREAAPAASVPPACRTDLVTVDGQPVGVRVVGTTADAAAGRPLAVEACGPPLRLGAGPHVVRTATGHATGIDVNRIVLSSGAGGGPDPSLGRADAIPGGGVPVRVVAQGRTSARVRVPATAAPVWLVLGQSFNSGWTARAAGRSLGRPALIDGYANGWLLPPGASRVVTVDWTPQRRVDIALAVSGIGFLVCVGLALFGRKAPVVAADPPVVDLTRRAGGGALFVVAVGALAAVLVSPVVGGVAAIAALVAVVTRRGGIVLGGAAAVALVAAAGLEAGGQLRHHYPLVLEWARHFETAGRIAWLGVVLLAAGAVLDHADR